MSPLFTLLAWSVVLLIAHILAQTLVFARDKGLGAAFSPRDDVPAATSVLHGRMTRAVHNFVETYAAFVGLALALVATNKGAGGLGVTGATIWFWARVVYLPIYGAGIPVVRTLVWTASIIGLAMMLVALVS